MSRQADRNTYDPYDPIDVTEVEVEGGLDCETQPYQEAVIGSEVLAKEQTTEASGYEPIHSDSQDAALYSDRDSQAPRQESSRPEGGRQVRPPAIPPRRRSSVGMPSWLQCPVPTLEAKSAGRQSPYYPWTAEFEAAQDLPSTTPRQAFLREKALFGLVTDFEALACKLAEVLAAEHGLPAHRRWLPPTAGLGGIAGGYKVLAGNVFLKTSVDHAGIYGGDAHAGKAASHELKSLRSLLDARVPGLYLPLMATARHAGMTIVAVARLPIGDGTLVYGSSDAGKSVRVRDPLMNEMVRRVCRKLNLGGHPVGVPPFAAPPPAPQWIRGEAEQSEGAPAAAGASGGTVHRGAIPSPDSGAAGGGGGSEEQEPVDPRRGAPGAGTASTGAVGSSAATSSDTSTSPILISSGVRRAPAVMSGALTGASTAAGLDEQSEMARAQDEQQRLHLAPATHTLHPRGTRVGRSGAERHYGGHTVLWGACDLEGHLVRSPVSGGATEGHGRRAERRYLLDTARLFPAFRADVSRSEAMPAVSQDLGPNADQRALVVIPRDELYPVREIHSREHGQSWFAQAKQVLGRMAGARLRYAEKIYAELTKARDEHTAAAAPDSLGTDGRCGSDGDSGGTGKAESTPGTPSPVGIASLLEAIRENPLREDDIRYTDLAEIAVVARAKRTPTGTGVMITASEIRAADESEQSPLVRREGNLGAPFTASELNAWLSGDVRRPAAGSEPVEASAGAVAPRSDTARGAVQYGVFQQPRDAERWKCITTHWAGIDMLEGLEPTARFGVSGSVPAMAHFPPGWHQDCSHVGSPQVLPQDIGGSQPGIPPVNSRASSLVGFEVRGDVILCLGVGQSLYKLMRPEAVLRHPVPLSSDAYSGFAQCRMCKNHSCGHCSGIFNRSVGNASLAVLRDRMRELARQLVDGSVSISDSEQLCSVLHSRGINLRYLGLLRASVRDLVDRELLEGEAASGAGASSFGGTSGVGDAVGGAGSGVSGASSRWIQSLLLQEMIARILRVALEERLRLAFRLNGRVRQAGLADTESFSDSDVASGVAASFMNVVFGRSRFSSRCWAQLLVAIQYKFGVLALSKAERDPNRSIFEDTGVKPVPLLLRFVALAGISFTSPATGISEEPADGSIGSSGGVERSSTESLSCWNSWDLTHDGPLARVLGTPSSMTESFAPFGSPLSLPTDAEAPIERVATVHVMPRSKPMMHRDKVIRSIEEMAVAMGRSRSGSSARGTGAAADPSVRRRSSVVASTDRVRSLIAIVEYAGEAFGERDPYTLRAQIQLGSELTRRGRALEGIERLQMALRKMSISDSHCGGAACVDGVARPSHGRSKAMDVRIPLHLTISAVEARCALGEALELQREHAIALETYRHALARVRLLAPLHPLVGKLSCCVGRVLLTQPAKSVRLHHVDAADALEKAVADGAEAVEVLRREELRHGASAITAVRAAFRVYDSLLAGSDSPSSIVQLLVPALLSGKVSDVATSIASTCHLVRGFVRKQALALADAGVADVQHETLGRTESKALSGIEQIVLTRTTREGVVVKILRGRGFEIPAGRPESTVALLPFCWNGEEDTVLALDAISKALLMPTENPQGFLKAADAGLSEAIGTCAQSTSESEATKQMLPSSSSDAPPKLERSTSDQIFDELQGKTGDDDEGGSGSSAGEPSAGARPSSSHTDRHSATPLEEQVQAVRAGRATLHRLVRSLALLEDMIGAPRGSHLGLSGRLFGSSGITGSADAFNEWVLGDDLLPQQLMLREFSLLEPEHGLVGAGGEAQAAGLGSVRSTEDLDSPPQELLDVLVDPSYVVAPVISSEFPLAIDMLGPSLRWAAAGEMACSLIRIHAGGASLPVSAVKEAYLEGPTRVRCTLCSTRHTGVLSAWFMPVRAGWYSMVVTVQVSEDAEIQEHESSRRCICVVAGLPDMEKTRVHAPSKAFSNQAVMLRIDCRDNCGNIRINALDNLRIVGDLSARHISATCRIRADVGLDGMVASSPPYASMAKPKGQGFGELNLSLGLLNGPDGHYQLDMQAATAPDGTFIQPPHWVAQRCIFECKDMVSGRWLLSCWTSSKLRSSNTSVLEVLPTPGVAVGCQQVINDMFSSEASICHMCSLQYGNKCVVCDNMLIGRSVVARLCQSHSRLHGGQTFSRPNCVRCKAPCLMNSRVAKLCGRCIISKSRKCVWRGQEQQAVGLKLQKHRARQRPAMGGGIARTEEETGKKKEGSSRFGLKGAQCGSVGIQIQIETCRMGHLQKQVSQ